MPNRAVEIYLGLITLSILTTAVLVAALSDVLPYGAYGSTVFAALIAVAILPGWGMLRAHSLRRALISGEIFRMDPKDLPRVEDHTYVGHGFLWKPSDAERLYHLAAQGTEPPEEVQALLGGNTLLHGLGISREKKILIADKKRTHHTLILGSPGEGKTRAIELMIRQIIEKGDVIVIVDPKGDSRLINVVRQVCGESGRSHQFRLVALPWAKESAAYNPLAKFGTPSEIADRLIAIMPPAGGESEAFRAYQWGATKAVVQGLFLADLPITIARILTGLRNMEEISRPFIKKRFPDLDSEHLADILSKYEAAVAGGRMARSPELDDLFHYQKQNPDYYSKMVASLIPQLERLSAGPKREILSPEVQPMCPTGDLATPEREILTWEGIDNQKLVVYFYLGSLHGEESANAVGKMLLLDFQAYIAARYSYGAVGMNRISLFVDEAHHLVTEPLLSSLAESRGANCAFLLATQTTAQFEQALGSKAVIKQILTQMWAYFQFQTRNSDEARDFSRLVGKRQMRVIGESFRYEPSFFDAGMSHVEDFRAQHTVGIQNREADLVPDWALCQLPTGHCFARIGGRTYKIRFPLVDDPTDTFTEDLKRRVAA